MEAERAQWMAKERQEQEEARRKLEVETEKLAQRVSMRGQGGARACGGCHFAPHSQKFSVESVFHSKSQPHRLAGVGQTHLPRWPALTSGAGLPLFPVVCTL